MTAAISIIPALPPEKLRDQWRTPWWLVRLLAERIGGRFDLDVAADAENSKAARYHTRADDGLVQPWIGHVFCNAPFSLGRQFTERAVEAMTSGEVLTVSLITLADISTRSWAMLEDAGAERVRLRGRFGCEPPPGVTSSMPQQTMAAWTLRRPAMTVAEARELYGPRATK